MLYIPVNQLRSGMVLGRDLPSDFFGLSLVAVGQPLTEKIILRIKDIGIPGAYIESKFASDIDLNVDAMLTPAMHRKLVMDIKKQFDSYTAQTVVSNDTINAFYDMASDMVTTVMSKDHVMLNLINIKRYDDYTYSHSAMVGLICTLIGTRLGLKSADLQSLATAGLMHDIGKMDVPLAITNKPARLTLEEYEIMKNHPSYAVERLRNNRMFNFVVLRGIECHHERYDGTGYPHGLVGENIPLYGRILALADVYDALTSKRSYRDSWTSHQAIEFMMSQANTHFDINILSVFLSVIAAFPVGTIVKLSNGFMGVVTANTPGMTLRPAIRVLYPPEMQGTDVNLALDPSYLNVTVLDTVEEMSDISDEVFMM